MIVDGRPRSYAVVGEPFGNPQGTNRWRRGNPRSRRETGRVRPGIMSGGRFARGLAWRRGTMRIGVIALLVVLSCGAAPGADELGLLGERVLEFARSHRG